MRFARHNILHNNNLVVVPFHGLDLFRTEKFLEMFENTYHESFHDLPILVLFVVHTLLLLVVVVVVVLVKTAD
jgi:hypothetical protein